MTCRSISRTAPFLTIFRHDRSFVLLSKKIYPQWSLHENDPSKRRTFCLIEWTNFETGRVIGGARNVNCDWHVGRSARPSYVVAIIREQWCTARVYLYAARCVAARKSRGRSAGARPDQDVRRWCTQITPQAGRNAEISKRYVTGPAPRMFIVA